MARELELTIKHLPRSCVALSDKGCIDSGGICHDLCLTMQGHKFNTNLFAIPVDEFNIVLGIHWPNQFGRIIWDFVARETEFGTTNFLKQGAVFCQLHIMEEEDGLETLLTELEYVFAHGTTRFDSYRDRPCGNDLKPRPAPIERRDLETML